jgi:rhodanese-related sulfurtransferase
MEVEMETNQQQTSYASKPPLKKAKEEERNITLKSARRDDEFQNEDIRDRYVSSFYM